MWSYLIKGHFPDYGVPEVKCKIENRWHTGMRMKLKEIKSERNRRKNYMKKNI